MLGDALLVLLAGGGTAALFLWVLEQANCELRGLKYQQEQALMSTAPIGINQIAVKRNLITSCISALVPFSTQELFMKGQALYYGRNIKCQDRMYKKYDIKMYNYSFGCI